MTIHPSRLARIRAHHEKLLTRVNYQQVPTAAESLLMLEHMTDLLNDHTNTHKGNR